MIHTKFSLKFSYFPMNLCEFWKFKWIPRNLIQKQIWKRKQKRATMLGLIRPKALAGQPSPWPQSARVAHARPTSGALLGVVTGGLGAPESVAQA
jgi:hypothetical protein